MYDRWFHRKTWENLMEESFSNWMAAWFEKPPCPEHRAPRSGWGIGTQGSPTPWVLGCFGSFWKNSVEDAFTHFLGERTWIWEWKRNSERSDSWLKITNNDFGSNHWNLSIFYGHSFICYSLFHKYSHVHYMRTCRTWYIHILVYSWRDLSSFQPFRNFKLEANLDGSLLQVLVYPHPKTKPEVGVGLNKAPGTPRGVAKPETCLVFFVFFLFKTRFHKRKGYLMHIQSPCFFRGLKMLVGNC